MRIQRVGLLILVLCGTTVLLGCSDESESPEAPEAPKTGTISALVIDKSLNYPVEDVAITVTPGNIVLKTDSNGLAIFEVPAGDYFVDATVCCAGPGGIEYHVQVTVQEETTARVTLQACLVCL